MIDPDGKIVSNGAPQTVGDPVLRTLLNDLLGLEAHEVREVQ